MNVHHRCAGMVNGYCSPQVDMGPLGGPPGQGGRAVRFGVCVGVSVFRYRVPMPVYNASRRIVLDAW